MLFGAVPAPASGSTYTVGPISTVSGACSTQNAAAIARCAAPEEAR
jgi:hypothetical protein